MKKNQLGFQSHKKYLAFVIGFCLGFVVIHPIAMVLGHVMHEINEPGAHLGLGSIIVEFLGSYTLSMLPWGLIFGIMSGFIGYEYISLKVQKEMLQAANASKDKFFSIIAHDLRNPFTTLIYSSSTLIKRYDTLPDDRKIKLIHSVLEASKRTHVLLENLLEWSRSQSGDIIPTPVEIDTRDLTQDVMRQVSDKAKVKSISLENQVSAPLFVIADLNMVSLSLRNLLENALKFTHSGGTVTIASRPVDQYIEISVEDSGIGMTEEELGMLFHIEQKMSKPGTNKEYGSGLGLILCKEFVEKNNGSISVSSQPDVGSRFSIRLPRRVR